MTMIHGSIWASTASLPLLWLHPSSPITQFAHAWLKPSSPSTQCASVCVLPSSPSHDILRIWSYIWSACWKDLSVNRSNLDWVLAAYKLICLHKESYLRSLGHQKYQITTHSDIAVSFAPTHSSITANCPPTHDFPPQGIWSMTLWFLQIDEVNCTNI